MKLNNGTIAAVLLVALGGDVYGESWEEKRVLWFDASAMEWKEALSVENEGVVFRHCYTQFPSCGPSRFSILSGRYPFETGMIRNGLHMDPGNSGFVSLTRHFREQGYRTARVGKVFHMSIPGGIGADGDDDAMAWDIAVNNTGWDAVPANHDELIRYAETLNPGISVSYLDPDIADEEMGGRSERGDAVRS